MFQKLLSLAGIAAFALTTLCCIKASMFNSQPQLTIKAEGNKAFDKCVIETFQIKSGNIEDCLEHCLENCRCQSFQICQNTKCQLCSSHKEENSSLLRDQEGCVYATYQMRSSIGTLQKLDDQCSGISCYMKYNCCLQSDLCPKNKTCKPINSLEQPWKRFICECPDGYHGDDCKQPLPKSCAGYLDGPRTESGMYKILDSNNSVYEVYCHFDSDGAWTLVLSYSAANGSSFNYEFEPFNKPLFESHPVGENALTWSGYRLSKPRMQSIKDDSSYLQFTCDYEKFHNIDASDYVQIQFGESDVFEPDLYTAYFPIDDVHGKIGEFYLNNCQIRLHQYASAVLHVHIDPSHTTCAELPTSSCSTNEYFRGYRQAPGCGEAVHRCTKDDISTTQLWFGTHNGTNPQG